MSNKKATIIWLSEIEKYYRERRCKVNLLSCFLARTNMRQSCANFMSKFGIRMGKLTPKLTTLSLRPFVRADACGHQRLPLPPVSRRKPSPLGGARALPSPDLTVDEIDTLAAVEEVAAVELADHGVAPFSLAATCSSPTARSSSTLKK